MKFKLHFIIILSLIFLTCEKGWLKKIIYPPGCTDETACNYDPGAPKDDGSCLYLDCADVCGGVSLEDNCGVCDENVENDGNFDNCGYCDNDPENDCVQDCNGEWGGNALEDNCGICDSDPENDCVQDCNGEWGGNTLEDNCGICDNDPENDCEQDCNGEWGGDDESCLVNDFDGNSYLTVTIGEKEWMAENLKTTHYQNGDPITHITINGYWGNFDEGEYGVYNNDPSYADTYGNLYNWAVVNDERGVCPVGWHVPMDVEWKELEMALGMSQSETDDTGYRGTNEGSKLAGNGDLWSNGNLESNAEFGTSGFVGLPSGYRHSYYGSYSELGYTGYFWSSSESSSGSAWYRILNYVSTSVNRGYDNKRNGFSIRCVRPVE